MTCPTSRAARALLGGAAILLFLGLGAAPAYAQPNLVITVPNPEPLEFGRVRDGSSVGPMNVVLTNTGDMPAVITGAVLGGGTNFSLGSTPAMIPAGMTGDFPVTCEPDTPGNRTVQLTVSYTGGTDVVVDIHCYTPTMWIDSADPRDFGDVEVGSSSAVANINIFNDDTVSRNITAFNFAGADCPRFGAVTPGVPVVLAAGAMTTVSFQFTPLIRGARSCTMTVDDNSGILDNTLALAGHGRAGELSVSTNGPIPFGNQRTGTTSGVMTFTITNTGDTGYALTVNSVAIPVADDEEDWIVEPFSGSLASAASTVIDVQFSPNTYLESPTGYGPQNAVITVDSDDPVDADETVSVTGTGTAVILGFSQDPEPFGSVAVVSPAAPVDRAVTVQNTGEIQLSVSAAALSGPDAAIFSIQGGGPPFTVNAGLSHDITVRCNPTTGTLGARSATLTLTSNADDGGSQAVGLTCTGTRPYIQVSSVALMDFGNIRAGTTSGAITRQITNQNNSNASLLTLNSVTDGSVRYTTTPPADMTLIPTQSEDFSATFSPLVDGVVNATLNISSNDPVTPSINISLTGNGVSPEITRTTPATLAFGNIVVNTTSGALQVTVRNDAATNAPEAFLTILTAGITLDASDNFDFTNGAGASATPFTLDFGETATWNVTCDPESAGAKTANFTLTTDDPDDGEGTVSVALTCTGITTALQVSPAPVAHGNVRLCEFDDEVVTLTNLSAQNLTVNSIGSSSSEFTIQVPPPVPTPFVLAPAANTTMTIRFAPTVMGLRSGNLSITHSDPTSPSVTTMSGTGVTTVMGMSDASYDFGDVRIDLTPPTHNIVLTNNGTGNFIISAASLASDADFNVVVLGPPNLGQTLTPTMSLTLQVTANPTTLGAKSDTLNITTNIPGACGPAMAAIPLAANGVVPDIDIDPASVGFGDQDVQATPATIPVTVSNTGTAPLELSDIQIAGTDAIRFDFTSNTLPFTVPVTQSAVVNVSYTPGIAGVNHAAVLRIVSDADSGMNMDIPLTGRGIDRLIVVDPGSLTFPPTYRNAATPSRLSVNIRNDGEAPLDITMVEKTGGGENAFTVGDNVPSSVAGLSQQMIDIDFLPTSGGDYMADLVISNDDDMSPVVMVPLSGMGVVPNFTPVDGDCEITVGTGIPTLITASADCTEGIGFTNMEPQALNVRELRLVDDDGNALSEAVARVVAFESADVGAGEQISVDVEITAEEPGDFNVTLELFVENDPVRVAFVTIRVRAIEVELRGGGCAAGDGASGGLAALLLLALAALARRVPVRARLRAARLLVLVALGLAVASPARAERTRNLDLGTFRPMPGIEAEMITLETPRVGASGAWMLGLFLNHAVNPLTLRSPQEPGMIDSLVSGRTAFDVAFAYAFAGRFEAGVVVPMLQQSGDQVMVVEGVPPGDGFAMGDVALHGKAFLAAAEPFSLGASATATVPTATDGNFAGVDGPTGHLRGLAEISAGRIEVAANAGFRVRGGGQFGDLDQGNELTYGLGASYRATRSLWAVAELFGAFGVGGTGSSKGASPLEAGLAARYRLNRALAVATGAGFGLQPGIGAPDLRGFLLITYAPAASVIAELPRDKPRLVDRRDDDGDKIVNADDRCPGDAEDLDGFQDADGCPDPDNDEDGFPDAGDPCPTEAEDKDGFKDDDGCLDADNDDDKIADAEDKCPDEPEDTDGFQDRDGCDDPDNDGDGIPDVIDQCATEAETINGIKDDDGCADSGDSLVMVMPDRIEVFEPVRFDVKTAKIARKSENVLGQVAGTLRANRDFVRVRIAVHVHPRGADDQQLSERRAQAVRKWLVTWGLEPERLEIKGYGSSRPLVPVNKRGAADVNDRVEFILLEKKLN